MHSCCVRDVLAELTRWWQEGHPVGMATVVGTWRSAPRPAGATMLVGADGTAADDRRGLLAGGRTGILHYGHDGERRGDDIAVFISSFAPRPRMLVFGAIDFAAAVARVGVFLGYKVTVCDAREVFATAKRCRDAGD